MLRETSRFRNYGGKANRRCFTDSDMDLYVWFRDEVPVRFHLTYNKQGYTRSISWNTDNGFDRWRFAQAEALATMLGFPHLFDALYLHESGTVRASKLANQFLHSSEHIAPWLADFIYARLLEYPERSAIRINPGAALRSF
ncbi:MAG: hypothetical protein JSW45_11240 [Thiotrichales bacterium]|nr:MAG: hypothetical protein JSW45_11240 [Thiotrichales bacterium]